MSFLSEIAAGNRKGDPSGSPYAMGIKIDQPSYQALAERRLL